MSYPKKLLRLRPTKGLALDIPANEVPPDFYTGGTNVIFRDGFAQRVGGSRDAYTQSTTDPVFHIRNVRAPGGVTESNFWLIFGQDEIQALETSNITDVSPSLTSVSSPWQWSTTLLNNLPIATNGLDAPIYWTGDTGDNFASLPDWPAGTVAKSIVAFRFHIFALDITEAAGHYESKIMWSAAAAAGSVPSSWTASATNEAGSAILADTDGPTYLGVPLQNTLIIFKPHSMYGVTYVGGEDKFSVQLLDADRGALTRHAAIDVGGQILVVADGDVGMTDGTNWHSIAQGRVRDYLFSQLSQDSYENLFVVHNRSKNEVWICYPTAGNTYCNEAIVYNVATDGWGIRTLADVTYADVGTVNDTAADESWNSDSDTWDSDESQWNSANYSLATEQLITATNGATLTLEDDDTATTVAATLFKHDLTMDEPERVKFVKKVHVRTNASPGTLYVRVGSRMSPTDSIIWDTEQTLTAPANVVNVRTQGKFISIEVRSSGTNVWQVTGLDLEYEKRGYQ